MQNTMTAKSLSIRDVASMMGKLRATAIAFSPAPLQLRSMQNLIKTTLRKNNSYETKLHLDKPTRQELTWWLKNLKIHNGRPMSLSPPDIIISTDASLEGWGAACMGQKAGGKWTLEQLGKHINVLEMIAIKRGLETFTRIHNVKAIHMQVDNTSALSYLLKMGGKTNQEMNAITKAIWDYLLRNRISCTAEYLPSNLNKEADEMSRSNDSSEWMLNPKLFEKICQIMGNPDVDLFASLASHQIDRYISWRPDPKAIATDAFQQDWRHKLGYAFPPFKLIGRTLRRAQAQHISSMIIVTPVWHTQPWYATLLAMTIQNPVLLPRTPELLKDPAGRLHPMILQHKLQLAAWLISGQDCKQREFQKGLLRSSHPQDQQALTAIMNQPGRSLVAGVNKDILIPFNVL
jgi:hypothetical protein